MKKLFLLSALVVMMLGVNAQNRLELGLKTGFNSTKLKLDYNNVDKNLVKDEAKNGFLFGAYGKIKLFGDVSFQPEIYYAKKQAGLTIEGVNYGGDIKTWDVPLLVNLQLLDLKVARIYGLAGPVASFISKDDLNDLKTSNWTFQAGGGISIWKLTADVRYEWGLSDISDLKTFDIGQKTNVLTFTLGYRLFGI
ncbi:porin family protein [Plebeiibacterium marinum]|uniref:PorT family protein n=1 Tax=Plebeiibacterium marinum TaxID=2992111 RepID=A0AAE3ME43_9BACT|nr:porin family protein [Plebeiobacterium marinum]MCW3805920.1 PorT family protein [Plebeiobacterium marinum]